jgi:hypothetical protein
MIAPASEESAALQLSAWQATINVVQHFNDVSMRVRNLFVTLVGASFAIVGYGARWTESASLSASTSHFMPVLSYIGIFACGAFWFFDRCWYHRLLVGAVRQAELLERLLTLYVPGIGLTGAISKESRFFIGSLEFNATLRLDLFYDSIAVAFVLLRWYITRQITASMMIALAVLIGIAAIAFYLSSRRQRSRVSQPR